jgi:hypothetical protein
MEKLYSKHWTIGEGDFELEPTQLAKMPPPGKTETTPAQAPKSPPETQPEATPQDKQQ